MRIPLKMANGAYVESLEALRENFDFSTVFKNYNDEGLCKWLKAFGYKEVLSQIEALDSSSHDFNENLCGILGVDYSALESTLLMCRAKPLIRALKKQSATRKVKTMKIIPL
jgi:hypothetical protein